MHADKRFDIETRHVRFTSSIILFFGSLSKITHFPHIPHFNLLSGEPVKFSEFNFVKRHRVRRLEYLPPGNLLVPGPTRWSKSMQYTYIYCVACDYRRRFGFWIIKYNPKPRKLFTR